MTVRFEEEPSRIMQPLTAEDAAAAVQELGLAEAGELPAIWRELGSHDVPAPADAADHSGHDMSQMQEPAADTAEPAADTAPVDHSGHDMSGMTEPAAEPAPVDHSEHDHD